MTCVRKFVGLIGLLIAAGLSSPSLAADKLTFMTSWYAQAEHGGYYQAKALGLYEKAGLDVTIKMGGPQVNGMQLLLAGEADVFNGFDFQTLAGVQQNLPLVTIAAAFQNDLQGVVTHPDVGGLDQLKGKTILISSASRASWWPWLRTRFGVTDDQAKPYTFNLQPFLVDSNAVQQAFATSEPFTLKQMGIAYKFYLFADQGYPPYGQSLVTRQELLRTKPDILKRFVRASMMGWKSYLEDPAPGNALIKIDNPKMSDELLAFALSEMKKLNVVGRGDAAQSGIGTITEARWKASYELMVASGLLKPETDWRKAFSTSIISDIRVMP